MTVIERLYDNAWYVRHAAPAMREQLAADVTRTWMAREEAFAKASNQLSDGAARTPGSTALALFLGNAVQAEYDRARARASEAERCTDIIGGHAFSIRRTPGPDGAMTIEVASCTLKRRATLTRISRSSPWTARMEDPQSRYAQRFTTDLGTDSWEALQRACAWIVGGRL